MATGCAMRPTQAMLMPVRIGAGATRGWGLGGIGSAARGSECKKIRERPAKGSIRIQAPTTAASAASPSLMGSNNNFGGTAEFAAKNNLLSSSATAAHSRFVSRHRARPPPVARIRSYSHLNLATKLSAMLSRPSICYGKGNGFCVVSRIDRPSTRRRQCGPLSLTWRAPKVLVRLRNSWTS